MMTARIALLLTLTVIFSGLGCSHSGKKDSFDTEKFYRERQQRQMAARELAEQEQEAATARTRTADDYERSGDLALAEGKQDKAFVSYLQGLQKDPALTSLHRKLGILFLDKGMTEEAKIEFLEVLKQHPDNQEALEKLGAAHYLAGEWEEAEHIFADVLKKDSVAWRACSYLGMLFNRKGRYEEAADHFERAIAIQPEAGSLYNNLGMTYLLKQDYEKAVKVLSEAVKRNAGDRAVNNLGVALVKMGCYREAFETFKAVHGEAGAYNNVGYAYLMEGKFDKARDAFTRAFEKSPKFYSRAYDNLQSTASLMERSSETQLHGIEIQGTP